MHGSGRVVIDLYTSADIVDGVRYWTVILQWTESMNLQCQALTHTMNSKQLARLKARGFVRLTNYVLLKAF